MNSMKRIFEAISVKSSIKDLKKYRFQGNANLEMVDVIFNIRKTTTCLKLAPF
jgi:hypothetical protein